MQYRNILVHMNGPQNTKSMLDAACQIVEDPNVHITGIYVKPNLFTGLYPESSVSTTMLKMQEDAAEEKAAEARLLFDKVVDSYGRQSDWHCETGYADEIVNKMSRYADLVVIGQNGGIDQSAPSHRIENNIVMGSARPVLIVPYIGFERTPGKKVLVAWNDSKEATRAVNDALPLLVNADLVDVLAVTNKADAEEVPTAEICVYLARHGVKAEASKTVANGLSTGDILLNRASERGIDLLVMGAYGHSRIREMVLGGATYNIMRHMTVPVLMSH